MFVAVDVELTAFLTPSLSFLPRRPAWSVERRRSRCVGLCFHSEAAGGRGGVRAGRSPRHVSPEAALVSLPFLPCRPSTPTSIETRLTPCSSMHCFAVVWLAVGGGFPIVRCVFPSTTALARSAPIWKPVVLNFFAHLPLDRSTDRRSKTPLLGLPQAPRSPAYDRLVRNPPLHLGPREVHQRTVQPNNLKLIDGSKEGARVGEGKEEGERYVKGGGE